MSVRAGRAAAASSAKWSAVEYGGLALISFASLVVYARFLSASAFGLFAIALSMVELAGVLVAMLFHDALVQRPQIAARHYDTAFSATLALSGALVALLAATAPLVAARLAAPQAAPVLLALSLSLPLAAASAPLVARRRRELDFRVLAASSLAGRGGGAAAGIAAAVLGFGVWSLVVQQLLFALLAALVLWLRAAERPRLRFGRREFRELIGFALACVSDLVLVFAVKRVFTLAASVLLGTQGAGLLALAFRAVDTFASIALACVSQTALPVLASLGADPARLRRAFLRAAALVCLVLYFAFALLGAAAPEVVAVLFGRRWLAVASYVTLLSLLLLSGALRTPMGAALKALGRPRALVLCQLAELGFVAAALALFGAPSVAAAIGIWLAREALGAALLAALFRRAAGVPLRALLGTARVPLAAAAALFAAVSAGRLLLPPGLEAPGALLALAGVGTAAYVGCVALLERSLLLELAHFVQAALRRAQPAL